MDNRQQIEDKAAEWMARRDSGTFNATDQAELDHWLGESSAHVVAYLRFEVVWREANRLKAVGAGFPVNVVPTVEQWRASPYFERPSMPETAAVTHPHAPWIRPRRLAWAAAAAVVLGLGLFALHGPDLRGAVYTTSVGALSAIPLSDGSKVTLNSDSQIRVALTGKERRIELKRGEAFFEVAKDRTRPFVVHAGDKRIVAVGTQFSVRRDAVNVSVIVTEGKVILEEDRTLSKVAALPLAAGSVGRAGRDGFSVHRQPLPTLEEALSWRSGFVVFHEAALTDAVAEFNRYTERKIEIQDPTIAGIRIAGNFRLTNVEAFLRLLEESLPIRVERKETATVLSAR